MNYKFIILIIFSCLFVSCLKTQRTEQTIIIVKIPPIYNDKLSRGENFYRFTHFLYPQEEIPNPIPKGLPNYDSLLHILVDEKGKITINSQDVGNISNTKVLQDKLTKLFQERKEIGAYEPNSRKVVKAVGIKADSSTKFGDFMKVLEAIKRSDAEPIVLLFDNDALTKAYRFSTSEK